MKCGICQQHLPHLTALCACRKDPHAGWELAGRYRLLGLVAQGGMGMIYRSLSLENNKLIAIKISRWSEALQHLRQLEPEAARREEEARVEREFQLLQKASSQSPHIVQAFDAVRDDPRLGLYYPMEFLEGLPLSKIAHWGDPLPTDVAIELVLQICDGISVTHGLGVVHRDLNPDNIFIVRTPEHPHYVKLIDFGIARDLYARRDIYNTGHDMAFGHLHYLAPEQVGYNPKTGDYETATAAKLDTRADIFTIGAILFHMLVGFPPFEDDTMEGLALRDWDFPENLLRAQQEGMLPTGLRDIISSCLAADPDQRPPDIFVLNDMLRGFQSNNLREPPAPFRQITPQADSSALWESLSEGTKPGQEGGLDSFSAEFDAVFYEDDIEEVTVTTEPSMSGYLQQTHAPEMVLSRNDVSIPSDVFDALDNAPDFFEGSGDSLFQSNDSLDPSRPLTYMQEQQANHPIEDLIEESLLNAHQPLPPPPKTPVALLFAFAIGALLVLGGVVYLIVS